MNGDIDLGVLDRMDDVLGGASETNDLVAEFLRSASAWSEAIASERTMGSGSEGHRAAHTLASSAAMVGALGLARRARALEEAFARGPFPDQEARSEIGAMLAAVRATWIDVGRAR